MKKILTVMLACLLMQSLFASSAKAQDPAGGGKNPPETIPKIVDVKITLEKTNPPNLIVEATGEVPTLGWKGAKLTRAIYKMQPKDGIQDYFLTAIRPDGIVGQAISKVNAKDKWNNVPKWVKGVRIHGKDGGIVEKVFGQKKKSSRRYIGTSDDGKLQSAIDNALEQMNKDLPEGGVADAMADWKLGKVTGTVGGIAGVNKIQVIIIAERTPRWQKKKGK